MRLLALPAPVSTRVVTAILQVLECMVDQAMSEEQVGGKLLSSLIGSRFVRGKNGVSTFQDSCVPVYIADTL